MADTEKAGPSYDLGSVNTDSLKEVLHTLSHAFPFVDESTKNAMHAQIDSLDSAGNPNAPVDEKSNADEVAALKARIAELEAGNQGNGS